METMGMSNLSSMHDKTKRERVKNDRVLNEYGLNRNVNNQMERSSWGS